MTAINDNILPFPSGTGWVPLVMVLLLLFVVGTQGFTSNIIETTATTAPSSLPPRHRHRHRQRHRHPFSLVKTSLSPSSSSSSNESVFRMYDSSSIQTTTTTTSETEAEVEAEIHPAVAGWPEKYKGSNKSGGGTFHVGPRKISDTFDVVAAAVVRDSSGSSSSSSDGERLFEELDVENWPTWTTSDKPKWQVGNVVRDKVMPYSELSYVISGKLRITYSISNNSNNSNISRDDDDDDGNTTGRTTATTGTEVVIIGPGEFVTFPKDFCATWEVLEEMTWYYYLY